MAAAACRAPAAPSWPLLPPLLLLAGLAGLAGALRVAYLPLDERFTTRQAFLSLAAATPFQVDTPAAAAISLQRAPADLAALDAWAAAAFAAADAAVVSLELFLYGGLISSRISNATTAEVLARLDALVALAAAHPNVRLHAGAVIMRIPSYNTVPCTEDVYYWASFGEDLFTFSYFSAKYAQTHNASDLAAAQAAEAKVPADIVADYLWRRARNYNVTAALVERAAASPGLLQSLYITQDDNALYGLNIDEAMRLRALADSLGLGDLVRIYPGADEVGLSMLARLVSDTMGEAAAASVAGVESTSGGSGAVDLEVVFRRADNASLFLVPNYEGQPMIFTLRDQIAAAGAAAPVLEGRQRRAPAGMRDSGGPLHAVLLVNNFGPDEFPQIEAPDQTTAGRSVEDYAVFTPFVCGDDNVLSVLSMADNRYSNGADVVAVQYLESRAARPECAAPPPTSNSRGLGLDRTAFAGWNTDGNTLGCAISNLVVLAWFADFGPGGASPGARLMPSVDALADARRRRAGGAAAVPAVRSHAFGATNASAANAYFNALRLLEDDHYQADLRQTLAAYAASVSGEGPDGLGLDLGFYSRFAFKPLASRLAEISSTFGGLGLELESAGFPWNRTFEISLFAQLAVPGGATEEL